MHILRISRNGPQQPNICLPKAMGASRAGLWVTLGHNKGEPPAIQAGAKSSLPRRAANGDRNIANQRKGKVHPAW